MANNTTDGGHIPYYDNISTAKDFTIDGIEIPNSYFNIGDDIKDKYKSLEFALKAMKDAWYKIEIIIENNQIKEIKIKEIKDGK